MQLIAEGWPTEGGVSRRPERHRAGKGRQAVDDESTEGQFFQPLRGSDVPNARPAGGEVVGRIVGLKFRVTPVPHQGKTGRNKGHQRVTAVGTETAPTCGAVRNSPVEVS